MVAHVFEVVVFHFVPVAFHLDLASQISGRRSIVSAEVLDEVCAVNLIECRCLGSNFDVPRIWVVL